MPDTACEHVLVVPTSEFHRLGHFQGFCDDATRYLDGLLRDDLLSYRPRGEMEEDPSFKQLIPYCLFRFAPPDDETQLFHYRRGSGQGESRLHAKRSVGVGGHISVDDGAGAAIDAYQTGLQRELDEELVINAEYEDRIVGLINDDESEVGRVHLGVVHLFDVKTPNVRPREADLCDAGFAPVGELLADLESFETWSSITLTALYGRAATPAS